jgi:LysM repeat protein
MVTPPDREYPVRVPTGTAATVAARYAELEPAARHAIAYHKVKKGETLAGVAKQYDASADLIRAANRSVTGNRLVAGSSIVVPLTTGIPASALREQSTLVHVVRSGETVSGIAKRYRVSVTAVRLANNLNTRSLIRVGQRLLIRDAAPVTPAASTAMKAKAPARSTTTASRTSGQTYVVQGGDTISGIAARFGVRQSSLVNANGIGDTAKIRAGQKLKIPPG